MLGLTYKLTYNFPLAKPLKCRLTNHSAAKNKLPQRFDTFSQRPIDFKHRRLIFLVSAGYYRCSFIKNMVKRCAWGICNTDTCFPERLEGGVHFFFLSQNLRHILTSHLAHAGNKYNVIHV